MADQIARVTLADGRTVLIGSVVREVSTGQPGPELHAPWLMVGHLREGRFEPDSSQPGISIADALAAATPQEGHRLTQACRQLLGVMAAEGQVATTVQARLRDELEAAAPLPPVRSSHLRHLPLQVNARGPAVRALGVDAPEAVTRFAAAGMSEGRVYGYATPGYRGAPADRALLIVPLNARSDAYPRSINGAKVKLARVPAPMAL